jgi:hypothetical protein
MMNARTALLGLASFFIISGASYAQDTDDNPAPKRTRLQLGVALAATTMPGTQTSSSIGPSLVWRWRGRFSRQEDRWGFSYRFSSFDSTVFSPVGAQSLPVADVKLRPLMAGVEYKMPRGRWTWSAGMSAGWAFNSIETPGGYRERALVVTGMDDLSVDLHDSLVWGPRVKGWYDINRKVSLLVESAYLVTRPTLDVRAAGVSSTRRLNADALVLKAGIVYGIF